MLKLTSVHDPIIYTLQGEGRWTGIPAIFIRLALCNLRCTWCDTAYTWDWQRYDPKTAIRTWPVADIIQRIKPYPSDYIIITGGEPLLQQAGLIALVKALTPYKIEIETNGTYTPDPDLDTAVMQYNVSPKLANSGASSLNLNPEALQWFAKSPKTLFKFVVIDASDVQHIQAFAADYGVEPTRIGLMPEGSATDANKAHWLVPACLDTGFRYIHRLHTHLSIR